LGIAIVSLLILLVIAVVAIPILARVLGEAASRNANRPGGEGEDEEDPSQQSGPKRD
jgi:flagellar basal body-associated protein FliL